MQNNALDAAAFFLAGGLTMVAHGAAMREGLANSEPWPVCIPDERGSADACALAPVEEVRVTQGCPDTMRIFDLQSS